MGINNIKVITGAFSITRQAIALDNSSPQARYAMFLAHWYQWNWTEAERALQGALEVMGIPYTGSGVMASALAMDKWRTKLVWLASGIPTPRYRVIDAKTDWMRVFAELGLPLIVKPAREGSTIGITKVSSADHDELPRAYEAAAKHDDLVLAEEFVEGQELTVSILGDRALPAIRIEAPQGNYDYHHKYFSNETRYFCPSGIPAALEAEIAQQIGRAHV